MANPFTKPADAEQINSRAGDLMLSIYRFAATRPVTPLTVAMLLLLVDNCATMACKCIILGLSEDEFKAQAAEVMKLVDQEVG